jgi:prepilin signal peptidase PulO-like enzyme (type II secretory pathway)
MEQFIIYLALVLVGLCMGSFAGASIWRLRARQLVQDKENGEKVNQKEYKRLHKLTETSMLNDHSVCLSCGYKLKWYDMIPLLSWLYLGGKCRKCRQPIGYLEPLIEIGVAVFFVISYAFWPYPLHSGLEITRLILWLIAGVVLAILFAYDKIWSLLPDKLNYTVIGIGAICAIFVIIGSQDKLNTLLSIIGSMIILSGIYWAIYKVSRGAWIGFGDVKLGLGLALLLADWRLAFIALFAANLIGSLIVIPAMAMKKLTRNSHVPFGPLLIIGFLIAGLAGNYLVNFYVYNLIYKL